MERYFALLKILEIGSFTKAAEAMGYSQSAVSQMVQSLESELSLKLLYRSRNGIKLTPEGEALLPYIQRTVNHYNAMLEKTRELKGLNGGLIRIGTLSSVSSQWLPGLIKDFQTLYPKVHFLLHQGDYTTIPAWVRAGEIDFGFVNPDAESVRGLHTIFVTSGGHKAVLHPDHPLAAQPWVTLEQLAKETFLLLEEGCLSEPLEAFRTLGLEPRVELRMHDNFSICSMVEANVGVSILPELALRKMNFRIVQLPTVPPVIRRVSLVMKDPDILPIASRYFIEFFLKRADTLP
ncbi:MAG: LysR substrate-binding domain-containing protein [Clostridiales bacterium]|uniref:LysR substrate-binding domain-containing protein n=1 Tax=Intestinimonas massiliensis (ex Afouda et al. 2020) TaxID=1673721 RepID=A0AAW5JRQ2_9FIRM|nr:LysR substrate-binding domain-containing protein [Intestinimonas massiliensis (ex Afouda et al. 2020)]MCG4529263.1 LysR substrate-binding domain-containing protein [Intestinimonas massiliensis (ex Afouda et al. 2020)]MCQ4771822.1 LysR substrate-binding domain-containing protein [Intestinimonas massiliensis (ex Afouda et al. 2020)]MCQ4808108.1 LysR substrate-binding domain-containing protein [Intestinimonas massiliensis (ex Afouda et al. 2020)]MDU1324508.1 LysR substrate-binding domain-contai